MNVPASKKKKCGQRPSDRRSGVEVPVNNADAQGVTPALRTNSDFLARRAVG